MVTNFPEMKGLMETSFQFFHHSTTDLLKFGSLVFLARICWNKLLLKGPISYGALLRDFLMMFIGFFMFEEVMNFVLEIPSYAESMINANPNEIDVSGLGEDAESSILFLTVKFAEIINFISIIVFWIIRFIYMVMIGLMIAIGGYIIFFSTILGVRWMGSVFAVILLIVSLWPFLWYSVDSALSNLMNDLIRRGSTYGVVITMLGAATLKLFIPVGSFVYGMKDPVALASKAGGLVMSGLRPGAQGMKLMGRAGGTAASKLGLDKVASKYIGKPKDKVVDGAGRVSENIGSKLSQVGPRVAYGTSRGLQKITPRARRRTSAKTYKEFEQELVVNDYMRTQRKENRAQARIDKKSAAKGGGAPTTSNVVESRTTTTVEKKLGSRMEVVSKKTIDKTRRIQRNARGSEVVHSSTKRENLVSQKGSKDVKVAKDSQNKSPQKPKARQTAKAKVDRETAKGKA